MPSPVTLVEVPSGVPSREGTGSAGRRGSNPRATALLVLKAVCAAALVSLVLAPVAKAGKYHVYSCRTPSGEAAPVDGWSGSAGPTYSDYAKDTCGEGGALTAALGDVTIHKADVDQATWTFSRPLKPRWSARRCGVRGRGRRRGRERDV